MNYYFMMDDKANKSFDFNVTYGNFAFEIREEPFDTSRSSIPFKYIYDPSAPESIYYNFVNKKDILKKIDFGYDYYKESAGFLISSKLLTVLKGFNVQGCVAKKIIFTVNGNIINSPDLYLLLFNTIHSPNFIREDFIDYERTEQLPSNSGALVTRNLVLKEDIAYDVFKLSGIDLLSSFGIIVTEEVKNAIESNDCGKGIRFLPIDTAQEEYCKHSFKDFNDLIKKTKPKLPF